MPGKFIVSKWYVFYIIVLESLEIGEESCQIN
jgi:hypothetical protein